jgi:hypothetical protein
MYMYTYTHTTRNPNPLMHINIMCAWIGELITKLSHNGLILHLFVSISLLSYTF